MPEQTTSALGRVQATGVRSASALDLIAVGFSRREKDVEGAEPLARTFLTRLGGLFQVGDLSPDFLKEVAGLDPFETARALALIELGRRVGIAGKGEIKTIAGPEDVYALLDHLRREKREHFYAILLDTKAGVIRSMPIHIGTLSMSVVGPREVFREAIREAASSIIVAHNHPSGDPTPSPEDFDVTDRLEQIGDMLDIPVLDHVIIGERRFVSLHELGAL